MNFISCSLNTPNFQNEDEWIHNKIYIWNNEIPNANYEGHCCIMTAPSLEQWIYFTNDTPYNIICCVFKLWSVNSLAAYSLHSLIVTRIVWITTTNLINPGIIQMLTILVIPGSGVTIPVIPGSRKGVTIPVIPGPGVTIPVIPGPGVDHPGRSRARGWLSQPFQCRGERSWLS